MLQWTIESIMIKLGRVKGSKMEDMKLSNNKLIERGTRMIMEELLIEKEVAFSLLYITPEIWFSKEGGRIL